MPYAAENKVLNFKGKNMDYVTFGRGQDPLVIIPGLGDGLATVKGMARNLALTYREFAKHKRVWVFSRINELTQGYSTRDMAANLAEAMDILGLDRVDVLGVSQGGMIAQWLAADYPHKVKKLVLTVTTAKAGQLGEERIGHWLDLSQNGTYKELMLDIASHSYTAKSFAYLKYAYLLLGIFGRVKDKQRIAIQAQACLLHDSRTILDKLSSPCLIIGAQDDHVLGLDASEELAHGIRHRQLEILENCGHALYEKNKDFQNIVLRFIES